MKSLLSVFLVLSSAVLSAEEPAVGSKLPDRGTWVKYYLEEVTIPKGQQQIAPEEITIKFLGEETHEDEIYVRLEFLLEPVHKRHVSKCLIVIRKEALLTGNLHKRDVSLLVSKPASLAAKDETSEISDPLAWPEFIVTVVLSGGLARWKEAHIAETEKPVAVNWKRGRASSRREASISRTFATGEQDRKAQLILTNVLHESPPNRVLQATVLHQESRFDEQSERWSEYESIGSLKLTLEDFGKGAEATLKE